MQNLLLIYGDKMAQSDKQYFKDFFEENKSIQNSFTVKDKKGMTHIFEREKTEYKFRKTKGLNRSKT